MKKIMMSLFFGVILVLSACGSGEEESTATDNASVDDGQAIYEASSCFSCHGRELEGASGPNLQEVGSRLSVDEIKSIIEEGKGPMPGGLVEDQEQLNKLAEWLSEKQ